MENQRIIRQKTGRIDSFTGRGMADVSVVVVVVILGGARGFSGIWMKEATTKKMKIRL